MVRPEKAGAPIPTFASHRDTFSCERRNQKGHWKTYDSGAVFEFEIPKSARCELTGISNSPHERAGEKRCVAKGSDADHQAAPP
jgi:hypothetical protein